MRWKSATHLTNDKALRCEQWSCYVYFDHVIKPLVVMAYFRGRPVIAAMVGLAGLAGVEGGKQEVERGEGGGRFIPY